MLLCEVRCSCGYSVSLRPLFFDGMALREKGSQHRFVDWVCPHCGAGSRFNVAEVPQLIAMKLLCFTPSCDVQ